MELGYAHPFFLLEWGAPRLEDNMRCLGPTHTLHEREREREKPSCPMETKWSWVEPLDSTMESSELRDMYDLYNREA